MSNVGDNIAQTLHEISHGLLLAPRTSAEGFTGVFARKNAFRFLARKWTAASLTQRETPTIVVYLRNRTEWYPRWSRVWPLSLVPPLSPFLLAGSTDSPFTLARSHVS